MIGRLLDHQRFNGGFSAALDLRSGRVAPPELKTPVLHLLAAPASPWNGGVEVQLVRRRIAESASAAFALLVPWGGRFRLEIWRRKRRYVGWLEAPRLALAVQRIADFLGTELIHIENLAGFAPDELLALGRTERPWVLSLFDFGAFCARPNLIEHPTLSFCGYSTDFGRCARCLGTTADVPARRRLSAAALLAAATAVVHPSEFQRREHLRLFPGLAPERHRVIPPVMGPRVVGPPPPRRDRPLRVAYLGSLQPHKGSRVFAEIVAGLNDSERRRLELSAYGGGNSHEIRALRRQGVFMHGYFRIGSLPRRLRQDGIDVALLLSIFPETYCLVLDDCREAGVPALVFDFAALGERVRRHGGGWRVDASEGAAGVLRCLRGLLRPDAPWPQPATPEASPELTYAALYAELRRQHEPTKTTTSP